MLYCKCFCWPWKSGCTEMPQTEQRLLGAFQQCRWIMECVSRFIWEAGRLCAGCMHFHPPCQINELCCQLFCTRRAEIKSSQLPPCQNCLQMYVMPASYQAGVWKRSLVSHPSVPDPKRHGWTTDEDGSLTIDWTKGPPAPEAVLQLMSC